MRWWMRVRLWLAVWLVGEGYSVVNGDEQDRAYNEMSEALMYVKRAGSLKRRARKRLHRRLFSALAAMFHAENDVYSNI